MINHSILYANLSVSRHSSQSFLCSSPFQRRSISTNRKSITALSLSLSLSLEKFFLSFSHSLDNHRYTSEFPQWALRGVAGVGDETDERVLRGFFVGALG